MSHLDHEYVNDWHEPRVLSPLITLLFGRDFVGGFLVTIVLSPILMVVLSYMFGGRIPAWDEQYKSFIVGDVLLAGVVGCAARIARQPVRVYTPDRKYWLKWIAVGQIVSVIFVFQEVLMKQASLLHILFSPHLFYHHIVLFVLYAGVIAGGIHIVFRRNPRHHLWLAVFALLIGYVVLVLMDYVHPPVVSG